MADEQYSKVSRRMWRDEKFRKLSRPQPNAQSLWQYLLTSPRSTPIPGVLAVGVLGLADDLDWPPDDVEDCFAEIVTAGMAIFDRESRTIFLPKTLRHNMPSNPSVVLGWGQHWRVLPEGPFREQIAEAFREILSAEDEEREGSGKPSGLLLAFRVVTGELSLAASGLRVGRPAAKDRGEHPTEHRGEHGVPMGVRSGVASPVKLQEQDQDQEQDQQHTLRARLPLALKVPTDLGLSPAEVTDLRAFLESHEDGPVEILASFAAQLRSTERRLSAKQIHVLVEHWRRSKQAPSAPRSRSPDVQGGTRDEARTREVQAATQAQREAKFGNSPV